MTSSNPTDRFADWCEEVTRPFIGPTRPAIIAHRFECPSCSAPAGEPCRLSPKFTQEWSHVSRHRVAQRALWQREMQEIERGTSPIASIRFAS